MQKESLRRYLEHGNDAGMREELRKWLLDHDSEEIRTAAQSGDFVEEVLQAFWQESLQNVAPAEMTEKRYRALTDRIFGQKRKRFAPNRILRWVAQSAAVLLLVVCVYGFAVRQIPPQPEWVEVYAPHGQTREITLPDGSRIWLNAGTYLFYPERFDRERRLFVSGEIYLDVKKDPERPFRVDTKNVDIRVLGTRFNLRSYNGDKYVEASLLEGSISLALKKDGDGTRFLMKPGDRLLVDNGTSEIVHERFDHTHYASWRDGYHAFRHMTLGEIARDLERIFDVQIVIRDASLLDETYFATFASGWELDELLDALNIHHTLRIRRDGSIIEIERARR